MNIDAFAQRKGAAAACRATVVATMLSAGCADYPRNGQVMNYLGADTRLNGYINFPSMAVEFQLFDSRTKAYSPYTTMTSSSSVTVTDGEGVSWYGFGKNINLPFDYQRYEGNSQSTIKASAKFFTKGVGYHSTFDVSADSCMSQYNTGRAVMANCKSTASPVLSLYIPCGTTLNYCCLKGGTNSVLDFCGPGTQCHYNGLCVATNWPAASDITGQDSFPLNANLDWSEDLNGLASDGTYWYFTQRYVILKVPMTTNLNQDLKNNDNVLYFGRQFVEPPGGEGELPPWNIPAGYDHMGDLDSYSGRLYIPIEGKPRPALIAEVRASDLSLYNYATIPNLSSGAVVADASWAAINPNDGNLYTSNFDDVSVIRVYSRTYPDGRHLALRELHSLQLLDEQGAPLRLFRIQGGAFSPSGKLYLSSDNGSHWGHPGPFHGIYGFQVSPNAARLRFHRVTAYNPPDDEIQGITIQDYTRTNGQRSQIQHIVIDKDIHNNDDVTFRHYVLSDASKL